MNTLNTVNLISTASPLDQFEILNYISLFAPVFNDINISLTNIGSYLTISLFLILSLNSLTTNYNKVISNG